MCCTHQLHRFHRVWMCARIWECACVSIKMCMCVRTSVHICVRTSVHACAYNCACVSQYISVVIIGFIIVTMHNTIVANFLLFFCRMMYCQLSNIGLDTGHTGFDTSLLDWIYISHFWLDAGQQLCSNNTCVELFKSQQIDSLVSSYNKLYFHVFFFELCCHSC